MAFLDIRTLRKAYGSAIALDGVDLSINEGEFVTLLGPSGSGKTTLLMSIAGFTRPDSGTILLDGADITGVDPEDRNFGLVFQGYALFPHLSVANNIAFPLRVRNWDKARIAARVDEVMKLVGLDKLAARKPRELSGGQQQRVAIGRALAFGPKILLLDEPLSALDRKLRDTMQRELKRLHQETGVTFVFVTHDQEEAYAMSDRIAVFQNGNIVQIGSPREIYRAPASRFVAGFLGGNNILSAQTDGAQLDLFGIRMPMPAAYDRTRHGDGAITVWVRPEDITLGDVAPGAVSFSVTVADVSFVGTSERVTVITADGQELSVLAPSAIARELTPGSAASCALLPSAIGFLARE
ncbi:MAG: ABC transporter ATP-binding protein [Mesorhizobium sp.]|uniref:ABC transporter ATP-binding protein n=1 Tax=Mesorhizobium sp. TaxID=1871066 RepID=UPI00121D7DC8|nr:ABC transporter ATP-binding protein [Mesorhizobium sp.]TIR24097.1 MAG: ABC transporter ATP-binding protein [Mesorhizobium sp.]